MWFIYVNSLCILCCSRTSDGNISDTVPGVDFSESAASLDTVNPSVSTLPPAKRRKAGHRDEVDEALLQHLENLDERRCQPQSMTDEELFGRHVATVLQRLPGRAQAMARLRIEQVLIDTVYMYASSSFCSLNCTVEKKHELRICVIL